MKCGYEMLMSMLNASPAIGAAFAEASAVPPNGYKLFAVVGTQPLSLAWGSSWASRHFPLARAISGHVLV
jgi:hypothetical protein